MADVRVTAPMVHERYAPDRAAGIDFGDLDAALAEHDFPATGREVIDRCGEVRLTHQRGSVRVAEALAPLAETTFDSAGAVHQAVLSVVGEAAVGREGYSDRDPVHRDEPGAENRSF